MQSAQNGFHKCLVIGGYPKSRSYFSGIRQDKVKKSADSASARISQHYKNHFISAEMHLKLPVLAYTKQVRSYRTIT